MYEAQNVKMTWDIKQVSHWTISDTKDSSAAEG